MRLRRVVLAVTVRAALGLALCVLLSSATPSAQRVPDWLPGEWAWAVSPTAMRDAIGDVVEAGLAGDSDLWGDESLQFGGWTRWSGPLSSRAEVPWKTAWPTVTALSAPADTTAPRREASRFGAGLSDLSGERWRRAGPYSFRAATDSLTGRHQLEIRASPRRFVVIGGRALDARLDLERIGGWVAGLDLAAFAALRPTALVSVATAAEQPADSSPRVEQRTLPSRLIRALPDTAALGLPVGHTGEYVGGLGSVSLVVEARPSGRPGPYEVRLVASPSRSSLYRFVWTPTWVAGQRALKAVRSPGCCDMSNRDLDSLLVVFARSDRYAFASGESGPAMRRALGAVDWPAFRDAPTARVLVGENGLFRGVTHADGRATVWTGAPPIPDPFVGAGWPRPFSFDAGDWTATTDDERWCQPRGAGRMALVSPSAVPGCQSGEDLAALARERPIIELRALARWTRRTLRRRRDSRSAGGARTGRGPRNRRRPERASGPSVSAATWWRTSRSSSTMDGGSPCPG